MSFKSTLNQGPTDLRRGTGSLVEQQGGGIDCIFQTAFVCFFTKCARWESKLSVLRSENCVLIYGGFLKWWYPTTIGFPTKNDHFGVFWGYHHLRKHPYVDPTSLLCDRQFFRTFKTNRWDLLGHS